VFIEKKLLIIIIIYYYYYFIILLLLLRPPDDDPENFMFYFCAIFFATGPLISETVQQRPVKSISVVGSQVSHEKITETFRPSLPFPNFYMGQKVHYNSSAMDMFLPQKVLEGLLFWLAL